MQYTDRYTQSLTFERFVELDDVRMVQLLHDLELTAECLLVFDVRLFDLLDCNLAA